MQPYMLPPKERIRHWRDFRNSLTQHSTDEDQLLLTAKYWNSYPIVDFSLNPDVPDSWPTPWEIINEGYVCPVSAPYMMEQTLIMANSKHWLPERLQLYYIDDKKISTQLMILVADAKYVVNYSRDELKYFDCIKKNCIIQNKYSTSNHYRHRLI